MVICPPPSFCLKTTLKLIDHWAEESGKEFAIKFHIILSYYLWTFDRLLLILTVVRSKVHPVSVQYRTHAIVFKGCLATPVGSESSLSLALNQALSAPQSL